MIEDPNRETRDPGVAIRAARPSDAAGIAALADMEGFRAGTLRLPYQTPEQARTFLESIGPADLSLVAERDGLIVGQAGWRRFAGRRSHAAEIGAGVRDDHQGRDIGTRLIAALIEAADLWHGIRRLELVVYADNVRAIALYERFGFVREGLLRGYALRHGVHVDSLAMARVRT